jgi:PTH2 family peptidyl-tRNA hydrolase
MTTREELDGKGRLVLLVNRNIEMSPGKLAAQAVHAALNAYGIEHGSVIVLTASPTKITNECSVIIKDAGLTEIPAGTMTVGVRKDSTGSGLIDAEGGITEA